MPLVSEAAACHECATEAVLLAALKDRRWLVRKEAARNPHATERVLRIAALDPDERVREVVATHQKAGKAARIVSVL